jgi:hypothetical protein
MSRRTALYLRFIVPLRVLARDRVIWWLENAIDRLQIDKCHRYDNAVTFYQFVNDDDLFGYDDDESF